MPRRTLPVGPSRTASETIRTVLPSGVRVVTENLPAVRSVAVGVWVDAGSRDETADEGGLTHFIEHLVFKGTATRRGWQINQRMEAVGGYLNAFTAKEHTCFYARGLDEHLPRALDTVLDLVARPTFPLKEIEKEKDVVVEEIKMYEDNPEDHVFDHFEAAIYPGHPLGRPIIGTPESVRSFTRSTLEGYLGRHFTPDRLVVAAAGRVRHDEVVRLTERALEGLSRAPNPPRRMTPAQAPEPETIIRRPIQQAHVVVGCLAPGALDERRTALAMLNVLLGAGMSSRLHQNIREKYGFCYSIYSFVNQTADAGDFGVYIGTDGSKVDRVRKLVGRELDKVASEPVNASTLHRAKQQLKGSILLGLESTSGMMQRLGRVELTYGRAISLDEVIDEIEAVTAEELRTLAAELFEPSRLSTVALVPDA